MNVLIIWITAIIATLSFSIQATTASLHQFNQMKLQHYLQTTKSFELTKANSNHSNQLIKARILFKQALSRHQLATLFSQQSSIQHVEAQVALPNTKTTLTVWFRNISAYGHTIKTALVHFEQRHAHNVHQQSDLQHHNRSPADWDLIQDLKKTAKQLKYTEIEVIATNHELMSLNQNTKAVFAIVVDSTNLDINNSLSPSSDAMPSISGFTINNHSSINVDHPQGSVNATIMCGAGGPYGEYNCPPDMAWVPSPAFVDGASNWISSTLKNFSSIDEEPDLHSDINRQFSKAYDHRLWSWG